MDKNNNELKYFYKENNEFSTFAIANTHEHNTRINSGLNMFPRGVNDIVNKENL